MNDLFDTPEKIKAATSDFMTLQQHPGWKLFTTIINNDLEVIKRVILTGTGNVEEDNRHRYKLQVYEEMLALPSSMIKKFDPIEVKKISDDPYTTVEQNNVDKSKRS
jgi:hypothetical protein